MAMKFEGVVNGTKYDNVRDYNEALKKALDAGGQVSAQSQTYSVADPVDEPEGNPSEHTETDEFALPGYNLDMLTGTENDGDIVSTFAEDTNGDMRKNDAEIILELPAEGRKNAMTALTQFKETAINNHKKNKEARRCISRDRLNLHSEIKKLEDRLNQLQNQDKEYLTKINICDGAEAILVRAIDYAEDVMNRVQANGTPAKKEPEAKPINHPFIDPDQLEGARRLIKEIFGL